MLETESIKAGNDQQVYATLTGFYEFSPEGEFFLFSLRDEHFIMLIDHDNNVKFMAVLEGSEVKGGFVSNIEVKMNPNNVPIATIPGLGFISANTLLVSLIAQKYDRQAREDIALNYNFINIL
jgi:hypothetical protein